MSVEYDQISRNRLNLQTYKGVYFGAHFKKENIAYAMNYKPKSGDKFLVTYPKCGTTWTQEIIHLLTDEQSSEEVLPVSDFFEMNGESIFERTRPLTVIKTHLPFHLVPYS